MRRDQRMKAFSSSATVKSIYAHIIGVTVSEMISDRMMATVRVTANSWKMRPTRPPISSTGRNTATSEMDMEMTVKVTSPAPFRAALMRLSPFSR